MHRTHLSWLIRSLVFLAVVVVWDASGLDLTTMQVWGTDQGFPLKNELWLSHVLHSRAQQAATMAYLLLWLLVWRPIGPWRALSRRERLASVLAVTASVVTISVLKHFSLTSCPWDLRQFGGSAEYISHWAWGVADQGGGKCFPGGHASSAFGFFAACLPFLLSPHIALRRHGRRLVVGVVLCGLVFGLTQTVRGAHYPSHTFWTAWICWSMGWLTYHLALRQKPQASPVAP